MVRSSWKMLAGWTQKSRSLQHKGCLSLSLSTEQFWCSVSHLQRSWNLSFSTSGVAAALDRTTILESNLLQQKTARDVLLLHSRMEMHAFILLSLHFEDARWLLICGRKSMKVPEQVEEPLAEMCSVCCNVFYKIGFSLTSVDCRNAPRLSRQRCWQLEWKKKGAQCSGMLHGHTSR